MSGTLPLWDQMNPLVDFAVALVALLCLLALCYLGRGR